MMQGPAVEPFRHGSRFSCSPDQEAAMKSPISITAALVLAAGVSVSFAQRNGAPPPEALEKPTNPPNRHGVADPQRETGTTGWSGRNRGAGTTNTGRGTAPSGLAADQPEMATGVDLKGPPKRFLPS